TIINEAMALYYVGNDSAIGKRLSFVSPGGGEIEIIGVVGDAKHGGLREAAPHMLYLPYVQAPAGSRPFGMTLEIRSAGSPESLVGAVRQAIREVDRNVPILAFTTLADEVNNSLAQERVVAGVAIGIPLVFAFARLISSQLYGITEGDPLSLCAAMAAQASIAAIASYIPARRATNVDPMVALHCE